MHTAIRRTIRNIAAVLSFALIFNQFSSAANAQDPTADAQMAAQSASQAAQTAMQASQAASAQASADAQAAASNSGQTISAPIQRSTPVPHLPNGPMPIQIAQARTVFLTNAGADANFPIDEIDAFNSVYAALKEWGRYQFVTSPNEADLIFQLRDIAPITDYNGYHDRVYSIASPAFELTIVDTKTNTVLWTVTSPAKVAGGAKARARWFSIAVTNLVSRIKVLAGQPLSASETASLTTVPQSHALRTGLILGGGLLAVGIGGGFLLHHEFENSLSDQKKSQDAFCNANHIPLSECAGG